MTEIALLEDVEPTRVSLLDAVDCVASEVVLGLTNSSFAKGLSQLKPEAVVESLEAVDAGVEVNEVNSSVMLEVGLVLCEEEVSGVSLIVNVDLLSVGILVTTFCVFSAGEVSEFVVIFEEVPSLRSVSSAMLFWLD